MSYVCSTGVSGRGGTGRRPRFRVYGLIGFRDSGLIKHNLVVLAIWQAASKDPQKMPPPQALKGLGFRV